MNTFQKHLAAIRSGRITRSNIIGLRKAFNAFEQSRQGSSTGRTSPRITADEYSEAERAIEEFHPTVTGELHESGLKVLRNKRYAKRWSERQQRIIDRACRFDLIRFDWISSRQCVPVYRVTSRDFEGFAFRNIPWQTAYYSGLEDGPRVVPERD